jgi:V/A-type H+-transporting ATPase subunit K
MVNEVAGGFNEEFVKGMAAIGAGLAVGIAGVGAGLGESGIGAAAVGAVAEDRGFIGLGLLFTVIPETIVIFGLVISFILMFAF